jgi:hypothetical protein
MKVFSKLFFVFFMMFVLVSGFSQQAQKNVVKSFNCNGQTDINLNLPGTVEIKTGDNETTIRIQINVSLANGNSGMLDELIKVGRYNLEAQTADGRLDISAPNTVKKIMVKGLELKESANFVVAVPKNCRVFVKGQPAEWASATAKGKN